ncbi:MAG TPA: hypothetical protein VFN74_22740 [Chloroflexota bacterium]|nr:hypothetical protein [Chloroflexota bacterium]
MSVAAAAAAGPWAALGLPGRLLAHMNALRRRRLDLMRGGTRRLLDQLEWEVERVLHLGRLGLWLGSLAVLIFGLGASPRGMLTAMISSAVSAVTGRDPRLAVEPGSPIDSLFVLLIFAGGIGIWLVYWLALSRSGSWRWLRYVAIAVDVLSVVRLAAPFRAADGGGGDSAPDFVHYFASRSPEAAASAVGDRLDVH